MLIREDIIKRVMDMQVLTNQTDVRTDVILLTIITMLLENIESRLTAIEINTMNAQGLPFDEPATPGTPKPTTPAATAQTSSKA